MSRISTHAKGAGSRHSEAPFLPERERYLRCYADSGATPGALCIKRNELIWIARLLPVTAPQGVDSSGCAPRLKSSRANPTRRPPSWTP